MFKENELRRTQQFYDAYQLLLPIFENKGIELDELIYILSDSIRDRIFTESELMDNAYRLIPNYLHTYPSKNEKELLEINCIFESNQRGGESTPSSARARLDIETKDVVSCEVSYEEIVSKPTSF